jgi:hypothetical protein
MLRGYYLKPQIVGNMLSKNLGAGSFRLAALKSVLRILISKFGVELINDKMAEIYHEEAERQEDSYLDVLSEAYDNINNMMRLKQYSDRPKT